MAVRYLKLRFFGDIVIFFVKYLFEFSYSNMTEHYNIKQMDLGKEKCWGKESLKILKYTPHKVL